MQDRNRVNDYEKIFRYYKSLAEKSCSGLTESQFFWALSVHSNSIAVLMKHLGGNMKSRWTNFLDSDGEKPDRHRDEEFVVDGQARENIEKIWHEGWKCLFNSLSEIDNSHLERIVYIRNEGHTVRQAVLRQIGHISYHVGQIVYLAKMQRTEDWKSLSIPLGGSEQFNQKKFLIKKGIRHFTDRKK